MVLAQGTFAQGTCFGLSLGANFSNLVGPGKITGSKPRLGFCPGFFLDFPTAYESYLEVGAFYSQQGVNIKTDDYDRDVINKTIRQLDEKANTYYAEPIHRNSTIRCKTNISKHVDYLCVPIMWKQSFGTLYGKIGPWAAFAINAYSQNKISLYFANDTIIKYDSKKDTTDIGKAFNQNFINSLRKYDLGVGLSIGYQTAIAQELDIFIDATYRMGFFSVEDEPLNRKATIRNMYFTISAGIVLVKDRRSRTYRRR